MLNKVLGLKSPIILPILSLLFILVTYLQTMLPSQAFHDAGEFQVIVNTMDIAHPTGYPTYIILGKILTSLIPFGEPAWKVNLLSVIYSMGFLFLFFLLVFILTKKWLIPTIGVFTLGFNQIIWNHAGMAGVDTLNVLFIFILTTLTFWWIQKRSVPVLFLFSFLFGLGLGNHLSLIHAIFGFIFIYARDFFKNKKDFSLSLILKNCSFFILGFSIYIFLPIRQAIGVSLVDVHLNNITNLFNYITGQSFLSLMYRGGLIQIFLKTFAGLNILITYFSCFGFLLGILGIISIFHKKDIFLTGLFIIFFAFLLFATNYPIADQSRYYLTFSSLYAVFICIGIYVLTKILINKIGSNNNRYLIVSSFQILFLILPVYLYNSNYKIVDKSQDYSASLYSANIFEKLPKGSVVISWWNYSTPLWYRQYVLNKRPDIKIINVGEEKWKFYVDYYIKSNPVYVVSQESSLMLDYYLQLDGNLYKVLEK